MITFLLWQSAENEENLCSNKDDIDSSVHKQGRCTPNNVMMPLRKLTYSVPFMISLCLMMIRNVSIIL